MMSEHEKFEKAVRNILPTLGMFDCHGIELALDEYVPHLVAAHDAAIAAERERWTEPCETCGGKDCFDTDGKPCPCPDCHGTGRVAKGTAALRDVRETTRRFAQLVYLGHSSEASQKKALEWVQADNARALKAGVK